MAQPALVNFSNAISFAENLVNGAPQLPDADIIFAAPDSGFGGGELRHSVSLTNCKMLRIVEVQRYGPH